MRKTNFPASRVLVLTCFFLSKNATAQFLQDTAVLNKSVANAIEVYLSFRGIQSPIYNGVEHKRYPSSIEGAAYFLTGEWQKGSVNYEGIVYDDVPLLYDVVRDELIIEHPSHIPLVPYVGKINGFSIPGHYFIRIDKKLNSKLKAGFYEQLTRGNVTALARREKFIEEKINGAQLERKFVRGDKYYFVKDDVYYPVETEKDILKVLKDHRNEIKQYLADNNLRYSNDPDATLRQAAEYYNLLSSH